MQASEKISYSPRVEPDLFKMLNCLEWMESQEWVQSYFGGESVLIYEVEQLRNKVYLALDDMETFGMVLEDLGPNLNELNYEYFNLIKNYWRLWSSIRTQPLHLDEPVA